jgi:ribose transport system permease protein
MDRSSQIGNFYKKYGIIIILVGEILIFSIYSDIFLSFDNIVGIGRQISFIGISAVGMTAIMLTAGIDISVGALLALSGVIGTKLCVDLGFPLGVSIVVTILIGLGFGVINGLLSTIFRVPPFIATLAMSTELQGKAFLLTNAIPLKGISDTFRYLGQGHIGGIIPVPLIAMICVFVFGWWLLEKTYIGRRIYAVGGNPEAARLAGINVNRIIISTYALCGVLTSFAGILMAGRLGSGQPAIGTDFPMDVITATAIGGVSLMGGKGSVVNVFFGAFIMGVLANGMIVCGISEYIQWITKGVVLALVVALRNINNRERL